MSRTGLVWTDRFFDHVTGPHHPDRPERLRAVHDRLSESGLLARLEIITPEPVDIELVESVHAREYVNRFRYACRQGEKSFDSPECVICPESYDIARLAAGGGVQAVDRVMDGTIRNAFCPVRPPGHHAERRTSMGFCFFNNIAIAAEHLRENHNVKRIALLDWDVHHGNGTQHHFEADPNTLFVSIHQHPYTIFPGTGFEEEKGIGDAVSKTLNLPMLPGSGDDAYRKAFEETILPATEAFQPEFILACVGFDPHRRDPLSQIECSTETFAWIARHVRQLADSICQGRLVTILEGGYDPPAIADCTQAHVETLMSQNGQVSST